MNTWVRLAVGLTLLLSIAVVVSYRTGLRRERDLVIAAGRAVLQLAVVAAALRGVFAAPVTSVLVVAVMFSVATWTAARRLRGGGDDGRGVGRAVVISCALGSAVVVAIIVALPTLDRNVRTFVAVSGIVLGGTMTGATLAGRHLNEGLRRRRDEIEAWLSIGAHPREAVRDVARAAASEALVPGLDQTRTVGLVTLPGAFIGALLGGASATGAARFQIVVLVGLMCAQVITVTTLTYLLGAPGPCRRSSRPTEALRPSRRLRTSDGRSWAAGHVSRSRRHSRAGTRRPRAGAAAGPSTGPVRARWSQAGPVRRR